MNNRPKDPKTARNKNVLVIGGDSDEQSGSLPCSAYIYGVRIYSAVASAAQVADLYNANK